MVSGRDIVWAAGFLEGEGAFTSAPPSSRRGWFSVQATQVQRWPLERLLSMFGGKICLTKQHLPSHKPVFHWGVEAVRAAGVVMTLYPFMSPNRQAQMRLWLVRWKDRLPHYRYRVACIRGHVYEPSALVVYGRRRFRKCLQCARATQRERRRQRKVQEAMNHGAI